MSLIHRYFAHRIDRDLTDRDQCRAPLDALYLDSIKSCHFDYLVTCLFNISAVTKATPSPDKFTVAAGAARDRHQGVEGRAIH